MSPEQVTIVAFVDAGLRALGLTPYSEVAGTAHELARSLEETAHALARADRRLLSTETTQPGQRGEVTRASRALTRYLALK